MSKYELCKVCGETANSDFTYASYYSHTDRRYTPIIRDRWKFYCSEECSYSEKWIGALFLAIIIFSNTFSNFI